MSRDNFGIHSGQYIVQKWDVQDRTNSGLTRVIYAGEAVKLAAAGSNYVIPLLDGDPEIGTDYFVGIAQNDSNETASADGTVNVMMAIPGVTVMRAKATTSANFDTAAEIRALKGDCVTCDVSSLNQTIDENEGTDDNVHGFVIVGGNPTTKEVYFTVKPLASVLGSNT